jgi:hypothetical protein
MVQVPIQSMSLLSPNHDIRHLIRQVLYLASMSTDQTNTPLAMSQKIVQLLYKTPSQLGREVYVAILDLLCHSFEDVAREALRWLLYAEDEVINRFFSSHCSECLEAEIQRACNCHTLTERPRQHHSPGPATCQDTIYRPSP